jgi:hypothetical protein
LSVALVANLGRIDSLAGPSIHRKRLFGEIENPSMYRRLGRPLDDLTLRAVQNPLRFARLRTI